MAKTLQQVMKEYPDLTANGFTYEDDVAAQFDENKDSLLKHSADFHYCIEWIERYIRPSKSFDNSIGGKSSYGLKHLAEEKSPNGYVRNGTFIAAVIALGDRHWKRIHRTPNISVAVRKPIDPWAPRYTDFYAWLKRHSERDDPVGDFARDTIAVRDVFVCLGNPIFESVTYAKLAQRTPFQSNELFDWFKSLSYYLDSVVMQTMIESFIAYYEECGQSQLFKLALSSIRMNPEMSEYLSKETQLREFIDELGDVF